METAKEMIQVSLPIKCLEAFILSLYPIKINFVLLCYNSLICQQDILLHH